MFGFGLPELMIVMVILLVVFGPAKLPQLGSALGGAIKNFKKGAEDPMVIAEGGKAKDDGGSPAP
ncbi:twin-arginine translocase TatA/TatE family subunit [Geotalea sp. SG265]|uniref:twin-arginine translocase TatA/TatE family subunit n=1 Tax=Geotalea sp. SG265 TaxID=2922867 RepID=UPI001FAEFF64|nr:twin-arginine translocase TatA/TatE family subunit [Geotalea sp. SG265]